MLHNRQEPQLERVGEVCWHTSEPDGIPDVGLSVYIGPHERLYVGEISDKLFADCGGAEHFNSADGWFLVHFKKDATDLIAKCGDQINAQAFVEHAALWLRSAVHGFERVREPA